MDQSRSDVPAITFTQRGDTIENAFAGHSYTFKLDGQDYPAGEPGLTVSWKRTGDRAYEATQKLNGQVATVTTTRISEDGKTARSSVRSNSGATTPEAVLTRLSGDAAGEPILGAWRLAVASPTTTFEPAPNGIHSRGSGNEYTAAFDSREYPVSGAAVAPNTVVSLSRIDERSFEETRKSGGAPVSRIRIELSPDGKTFTRTFTDLQTASAKPSVSVWTRQ